MENYLNTLSDMFYLNKNPLIITDLDGDNCILNKKCKEQLNTETIESIFEILPDIKLEADKMEQTCTLKGVEEDINLEVQFFEDSNHWVIELGKCSCNDWNEFVNFQKILHVIFLELLAVTDEKHLYKVLIERVKKLLKIDRIGILIYDITTETIHGSWGTDKDGNILDQSNYKVKFDKNSMVQEALALRDYVVIEHDVPLADEGIIIGKGWNATTAFFAGHKPIGWISCDNALTHEPLPKWKREILGELGRMTGELVFHLRVEKHLQEQVESKTKELEETIDELKLTQKHLIEAEKMASLGSLVAGVSHEINTPVGVALTATSHLNESTKEIQDIIDSNKLKKKDLTKFLQNNLAGSNLAVSSLKKAAELINNFKQLAVVKDSDLKQDIILYDLIKNSILSFQYTNDLDNIEINNNVDKSIALHSYPMGLFQIFTHLISNSLIHGFKNSDVGVINIDAVKKSHKLKIIYNDNGAGIPKKLHKKVFDPFFTTIRSEGRTGLGLNIIYNQVMKLKGTISLSNNKPSGVMVEIVLPLQ